MSQDRSAQAPSADKAGEHGGASYRARNAVVLAVVGIVWLALDIVSKRFFSEALANGGSVDSPVPGLFHFALVHNTGGAWGMFGDSTMPLAILSIVVVVALSVYLLAFAPRANLGQALGVALVVAGGIGNVIDRLSLGYVVDFIELSFMDFPVFNIADIGVTCGFVLLIVSLLAEWRRA